MAVLLEQGRADVFGLLADALPRMEREVSRVLNRLPCYLLVVLVVERQHSAQQQGCDDTERPVVNFFAVGLLEKHLWGNVRERSERVQTGLIWSDNLRQAKVHDFEARFFRVVLHQDVLGLQISVGHTVGMQVVQSCRDLVGQLLGSLLCQRELSLL